eukprot:TRINITY_DN4129_c0_g1_i1.p1 TRINITY_DN4129_c0_g1~~TRINITY_DN4129_c0_g1_i1.p1  ORF type:complete len:524 (-),score=68.00 TRINITY_DN4129_c0_g1_i1:117-1688(-)
MDGEQWRHEAPRSQAGFHSGSFMAEGLGPRHAATSSPTPGSTIIDLAQMTEEPANAAPEVLVGGTPVGSTNTTLRSRAAAGPSGGTASPSIPNNTPPAPSHAPQAARRDPFAGLRVVNDNNHHHHHEPNRQRRPARETPSDEEPIIDEILAILPPEIRDICLRVGGAIYPSLQFVNVRTDLQETGEEIIFNAKPSKLRGYTAGLAFHLIAIVVSFVVCMLAELVASDFFDYPFFFFDSTGIFSAWIFFLWSGVLSSAVWYLKGSRVAIDPKTFLQKFINSVLVAIIEEVGYRWLYIGVAMIGLHTFNLFLHHAGLWLGVLVLVLAMGFFILAVIFSAGALRDINAVQRFFAKFNPTYTMIGAAVIMVVGLFLIAGGLLWGSFFDVVWDYIFLPITNALSLWRFDDMLNGWFAGFTGPIEMRKWRSKARREAWKAAASNRFFVYGMILSNITYRDGHKYQGLVGWINSWYVGLVLLSSMVHYGFFTAIVIHLLYEIQFTAIGYLFCTLGWSRGSKTSYVSAIPK